MRGLVVAVAGFAGAGPVAVQPCERFFVKAGGAAAPLEFLEQLLVDHDEGREAGDRDEHPEDGEGALRQGEPNQQESAHGHCQFAVTQHTVVPFLVGDFGAPFGKALRIEGAGVGVMLHLYCRAKVKDLRQFGGRRSSGTVPESVKPAKRINARR